MAVMGSSGYEIPGKTLEDALGEIERLRAALSDVATFVSAPRPAAMSELDWAYCNLSTMQSYAREALGVNEQSAPKTLAEKVKEASRRPVSDRDG